MKQRFDDFDEKKRLYLPQKSGKCVLHSLAVFPVIWQVWGVFHYVKTLFFIFLAQHATVKFIIIHAGRLYQTKGLEHGR